MKKSGSILLFVFLMQISCGHPRNREIVLVKDGKTTYKIIIPAAPTSKETKAALLLQNYFKIVSGCQLPVVKEQGMEQGPALFLGNTKRAEKYTEANSAIKGEGFYITSDDTNVFLKGGSGHGIGYAVYSFSEEFLGCLKYADIPLEYNPKSVVSIPSGYYKLENPAFIYRESYYPQSADAEYLQWHKLHRFEDLWGIWGHSLKKIVPAEKYYTAHPEYYALVNGKRVSSQLCLSNKVVDEIVCKWLRSAIPNHPDAIYWSLGPDDNDDYCTCPQCRQADLEEGSNSGTLIRFVNRIAARFPEQKFTTLAYKQTVNPPSKTKLLPNVIIILSDIEAERREPLSISHSASSFRKHLQDWTSTGASVFIWDYTTQFTNYLAPFPDYNTEASNIKYFAKNNVKGVFMQGSGDTYSDMAEMKSYLQSKLLWNPDQNIAGLRDDFINGYYGKAGRFINEYLKKLDEESQKASATLDIYGSPLNNRKDYLSPKRIAEFTQLFDQAEAIIRQQPELLLRIKKARLPLEYTILQQAKVWPQDRNGYLIKSGNGYSLNPDFILRVRQFTHHCKEAGVKELSENGLTPEAYNKEWENILSQAKQTNLALGARVTLAFPFSGEFPANREKTLVDRCFGSSDYSYNWLFMYGNDMVATLDLGENKDFKSVKMNFLDDRRHHICLPSAITICTSDDGKDYRLLEEKTPKMHNFDDSPAICPFVFNKTASGRFIKIIAKCPVSVPGTDMGKKKPAICCDEIIVQ